MGVPQLFRYLAQRYPLIIQDANAVTRPSFDNFYVDFNGVIHNCTHANRDLSGDDASTLESKSQKEIMFAIFKAVEDLFDVVEPQKLLFLAIDGVAPRAKMNQQRQRRYKSALERQKAVEHHSQNPDAASKVEEMFDSNCISPGTEFMAELTSQLKSFIQNKINNDRRWRNIRVILSGSEVPGEGEHKISEFIRSLKSQAKYDPYTTHCLYGLDADLIGLGLASHEPYFTLLREKVIFRSKKAREEEKALAKQGVLFQQTDAYNFVSINVLREYLDMEFRSHVTNFKFNLERVIDDFVFLCFLVGNDFLPCLPFLEIDENGIDTVLAAYKSFVSKGETGWNNYLVNAYEGKVQFKQFWDLLSSLSTSESTAIFQRVEAVKKQNETKVEGQQATEVKEGAEKSLKDMLGLSSDSAVTPTLDLESLQSVAKYKRDYYVGNRVLEAAEEKEETPKDDPTLRDVAQKYMEGLIWTLNYYYQGHLSWSWYYPYFSAPFVQDVVHQLKSAAQEESGLSLSFNMSKPLSPLTQLLCILPPLSHKLLPSSYASLLTEESSPLAAAFPKTHDWIRDAKGREWRDVAVIPFIDENLVEKTLSEKKAELNEEEKKRNGFGTPTLFAYDANEKGEKVPNPFLGEETTINRCKVSNFVLPPYQNRAAMIKDIEAIVQAESAKQQQQQQQQTSNTKAKVEEEEDDDFEETSSARKKRGNKRAAQAKKAPAPAAPAPAPVVPASTTSEVPPAASGKSENFLPAPHPLWKELEGVNNFPYVKSLKFSSKLEKIGVKVVGGGASRHQTMVVQPESFNGDALQLANKWIDHNLFAEWPYLVEAQVLEVHTPTLRYYRNQKGKLMQEPMISQQFTAKETEVRSSLSDYNGVRLSAPSNCLVLLRLFSGMSVRNGSRTRRYAEEKLYPAEVLPLDSFMVNKIAQQHDRIKRYAVFTSIPNEKILPVGSKVFYIGAQSGAHGAYGTVTASSSKGFDLELEVSTLVGNFGTQVVGTVGKEKWSSNQEASQALGISPLTLSRITGSITFRGSENGVANELDLGLGIKYARKDLLVLGYARRSFIKGRNPNDNPRAIWEYSEKTMNILRDWKEKFPEFFTNVNKDPSLDAFDPAVIFPEKSAERVKEMSQWLSENPALSQPLVPCDSSALSKDLVKMVEAKAVEHVDNISKARNPYKKIVLKNVESSEILNPHYADESWTAGHGKKFELGDRVVYIRDTGAVPVNYQGTVVGINRSNCEVVFDREFLAGTKLQGRVDGLRGASVDVSCLLNLTHADMVFVTKEQKVEKKTTKTVSKNLWDVLGDE